jgi:acetyltransferase-like isoleucine patch superfamily enzyme
MRFQNWKFPEIEEGKPTRYNWVVQNKENLSLGAYTDIGAFTYINAKHGVTLEEYVQIGSHCSLYSLSTIDNKEGPVILKRNCRIGTHSVIMPGVTVGENSIVGAFSFVNADIPPGVIAFGVPAKVFRELSQKERETMARGNIV